MRDAPSVAISRDYREDAYTYIYIYIYTLDSLTVLVKSYKEAQLQAVQSSRQIDFERGFARNTTKPSNKTTLARAAVLRAKLLRIALEQ